MWEECGFGNWIRLQTMHHHTNEILPRITLLATLMKLLIGSLFFDIERGIVGTIIHESTKICGSFIWNLIHSTTRIIEGKRIFNFQIVIFSEDIFLNCVFISVFLTQARISFTSHSGYIICTDVISLCLSGCDMSCYLMLPSN